MHARLLARLLAPATVLVLLAGCSAGNDVAAPRTPDAAPTSAAVATSAAAPEPSPTPSAQVIEVSYAGGEISGVESQVPVKVGEQVLLRVTSDVAEEIHVHGYDLYADIPAGGTGEVTFAAELAGRWEVELHKAGRPLFTLRVS